MKTGVSSTMNRGDIVQLKHGGNYKTSLLSTLVKTNHLFVVLKVISNSKILISPISSNTNSNAVKNISRNVVLKSLTGTGLKKQSYVDASTTGIIDTSNVYRVIGSVSSTDLNTILNEYSKTNQRRVVEVYKVYNSGEPEYLDYFVDKEGKINYVEI